VPAAISTIWPGAAARKPRPTVRHGAAAVQAAASSPAGDRKTDAPLTGGGGVVQAAVATVRTAAAERLPAPSRASTRTVWDVAQPRPEKVVPVPVTVPAATPSSAIA
jgi:hypothetical protein